MDHEQLPIGTAESDIQAFIDREHEKYIKHLERTLQAEPEYNEIKEFIDHHPEEKKKYLKTIALKYTQGSPIPLGEPLELNEYNSFTSKHKGNRVWSETKSNPNRESHYSSSVRNSRYKAMDEEGKRSYFQNLKVIKKLQNEKKKREKLIHYYEDKKQEKLTLIEQKKKEEEDKKKEIREKEMQEWKEKMIQKTMERKMLRQKHLRESEHKLKELSTLEPLHNKIEKRYIEEFEIPELEKRKKILEDLRNLPYHSKTDIEDIKKHSAEYEKLRKKRLNERMAERMENLKSHSKFSIHQYKTKTFEQMAMRDEMQASIEEEKRQERLRLVQNKKHYAKNVIDLHRPTISKRKQEEMQKIIEDTNRSPTEKINRIKYERSQDSVLNNPLVHSFQGGRRSKFGTDEMKYGSNLSSISHVDDHISSPTGRGKQDIRDPRGSPKYADGLESVPENVAKYETALNPSQDYYNQRSKTTIRGSVKKNSTLSEPSHKFVKYDYLAQQRNKRIEDGGFDYKEKEFWKQDIVNNEKSALDKYHEIKFKTDDLERKAKQKESQLNSVYANGEVKKSEEVSSMYMDAIRAKAALLANL